MSLLPSVYTVESVTKGHPDRVCDQIADRILHEIIQRDPHARVAVEVFGCKGVVTIGGEVTTNAMVDYEALASEMLESVGYDSVEFRLHLNQQSPQISAAVSAGGAGDQGIMYGYATADTQSHLPLGVDLVGRGLAREVLISVAYAIGIDEPVMLHAINENREEITHLIDPTLFFASRLRSS